MCKGLPPLSNKKKDKINFNERRRWRGQQGDILLEDGTEE